MLSEETGGRRIVSDCVGREELFILDFLELEGVNVELGIDMRGIGNDSTDIVDSALDEVPLIAKEGETEGDASVGNVCLFDAVSEGPRQIAIVPEPVLLGDEIETRRQTAVPRNFTHVHGAQFPDLRSDRELLH
jgi:hypothetical protein